jgi:hypothetical protein
MPQLTFLPWLRVEEPATFGALTLVPKEAALEGLAGHDRAFADAMCAAYVELHADKKGEHAQASVSFLRYKDKVLTAELTNEEFNEAARQLRVLGAVAQAPTQFQRAPSNCFVPIGQRYQDGSFGLAIVSGKLTSAGLDIRRARFSRPTFVSTNAKLDITENALRVATDKLVQTIEPTKRQRVLIRALEWYFWAHVDDDEQNSFVPFVLLQTAFDTLTDERSSKLAFAHTIAKRLATPDDVTLKKTIEGKQEELNEQGWWAHSFYTFRSETVHGKELAPGAAVYNSRSHFDLGSIAFRILVRQELLKMELLDSPLGIVGTSLFLDMLRKAPDNE